MKLETAQQAKGDSMFDKITIPYESVMLFNVVQLKEGVDIEHVEEHIGYMCNVVKNTYDGFIAGQVFRFDGFVSEQGSIGDANEHNETHGQHLAIVTYWSSFDEHEKSHANEKFKTAFSDLAEFCEHTFESGYSLLWQGNGLQYKD